MLTYWLERHGDIDGHSDFDEESYRHYYPALMHARDNYLMSKKIFEELCEKIEYEN